MEDVLQQMHDSPSGGRFGVTKTLAKVKERFYWLRLRGDVENWCRRCDECTSRIRLAVVASSKSTTWEHLSKGLPSMLCDRCLERKKATDSSWSSWTTLRNGPKSTRWKNRKPLPSPIFW
ncbi:hypothetical protein JGG43_23820 [Salmonella enterica subsp. enterica serovar Typhimurium]|nr:hypothetical protein [Salmonella enterica subsp. enterica serovar Typhimurium]